MSARYRLARAAAQDLSEIWNYLERQAGDGVANRVEQALLARMTFLAHNPGAGHARPDTEEAVKFFPVYSYLIVYRPDYNPLQIAAVLHARRDLPSLLQRRP